MKHAAGTEGRPGSRLAQLPYLLVLVGAGAALGVIALGPRRAQGGTLVMAGVLLAAALARMLLPDRRAGLLGTRRRVVDVLTLGALGTGLLVAGLVLPPPG